MHSYTFLKLPFFMLAIGIVGFLVLAGIVTAQTVTYPPDDTATEEATGTDDTTNQAASDVETTPAPAVLEIGSDGNVLLRGVVTGVNGDSMTVESWLGEWTVQMTDGGSVVSDGETVTDQLPQMNSGDFVGIEGTINDTDSMTIDANFVRNWTTDPYPLAFAETEFQNPLSENANIGSEATGSSESATDTTDINTPASTGTDSSGTGTSVVDTVDTTGTGTGGNTGTSAATSGSAPVTAWTGTVDEITGDSFTYTDDHGNQYTVNIGDALITDENDATIGAEEISSGDEVAIDGSIQGETITASRVSVDQDWLNF